MCSVIKSSWRTHTHMHQFMGLFCFVSRITDFKIINSFLCRICWNEPNKTKLLQLFDTKICVWKKSGQFTQFRLSHCRNTNEGVAATLYILKNSFFYCLFCSLAPFLCRAVVSIHRNWQHTSIECTYLITHISYSLDHHHPHRQPKSVGKWGIEADKN